MMDQRTGPAPQTAAIEDLSLEEIEIPRMRAEPCANTAAPPGDCCDACREAPEDQEVALHDLMAGARRLFITHGERRYMLRITRQNKLILTRDETAGHERRLQA